jgi:chromosome segregation ATPase
LAGTITLDDLARQLADFSAAVIRRFDNVDAELRAHDERLERLDRQVEGMRNLIAAVHQDLAAIHQDLANLTTDFGDFLGRARRQRDRLADLERRVSVLERK